MRHFDPIEQDGKCDVCKAPVQKQSARSVDARTGEYSRATVVRYDHSDRKFVYCSNRCVNADYDRSSGLVRADERRLVRTVGTRVYVHTGAYADTTGVVSKVRGPEVTVEVACGTITVDSTDLVPTVRR